MKKLLFFLTLIVALSVMMPIPVYADMGPKPSIEIEIEGLLNGQECYATILFDKSSVSGPHQSWEQFDAEEIEYRFDEEERRIFYKFAEYQDADGYIYVGQNFNCFERRSISLGYYPPYQFKVLLYFPESDTYAASDVMERYAFDSYYTVYLNNDDGNILSMTHSEERHKYILPIIGAFLIRFSLTVLIETIVAVPFFLRNKKQFLIILLVNVLTQVLLNLSLSLLARLYMLYVIMLYALFELIVFIVEAVLYLKLLPKHEKPNKDGLIKNKTSSYVWYALIANCISFICGLVLSEIVPTWF